MNNRSMLEARWSTVFITMVALALAVLIAVPSLWAAPAAAAEYTLDLPQDTSRIWIAPELWANRLHDWRLENGRIICTADENRLGMRTLHLLTHRLADRRGSFRVTVETGWLGENDQAPSPGAFSGLLFGIGGAEMDYRSAALVHDFAGPGAGLVGGVTPGGQAFFADFEAGQVKPPDDTTEAKQLSLTLTGEPVDDGYALTLVALDADGKELSRATRQVVDHRVIGAIALLSHPGRKQGGSSGRFAFTGFEVSGDKIDADASRTFGPIASTKYTLSRKTLKLSAQLLPVGIGELGTGDSDTVVLEVNKNGAWQQIADADVVVPGFVATFRVTDWDDTEDTPFRVRYRAAVGEGQKDFTFGGTIRHDPLEKPEIVVAGFTGNHNNSHRIGNRQNSPWQTGVWFPHADICRAVAEHDPDLLFFSGDQVYEGRSPTFADRQNIKLDYLYKWYLWCWAYRDLTRDIPAICIPDDHDVYQGNLWGEGGRPTDKDDKGGYVHPADFVKMVELTQTSNLPDPFDPTPIEQGIGVYYTSLNWGRLSVAVIEDRKFKSGCNGRVPPGGSNRADHIVNPDYDVLSVDLPGLELLGDRQEEFLRHWAADWQGADMKLVVSQTVFAGLATHHGGGLQYLIADLDSNGWPQSGRNRALAEMRRGFAFHLAGDQHLATLAHHGIDEWEDAIWSFAVPSVANFYPRMWKPPEPGENRLPGYPQWTGRHFDGLENRVTVYAATNPDWSPGYEPADLHDKMPGYGIVRFNRYARTITVECWPRYADPRDPAAEQYSGWPRTIFQNDNYGRRAVAWLPMLRVEGIANPVVQVFDGSGELVYAIRNRGPFMRPKVFAEGKYTVKVGDPDTNQWQTLELDAVPERSGVVDVRF